MRIAYFTNQYPATSHTFIRREILALEGLGVTVIRYALWATAKDLVHPEDVLENQKTRYILKAGYSEIFRCLIAALTERPIATLKMVLSAMRMGWRSDRGLLRHMGYAIESVVLATWSTRDRVQHLHAHFGTNSAAIAMLAGQISNIPYSFTAHGSEEFEKAPLLSLDEKLRRSTFAVCVSSFGRSQLMRWSSPEHWPKIEIIHCGLDETFFEESLLPPSSAPRFVCVGRLGEHKAQLVLVGAVRRLREAGIECEVVLAGDGPMRPQLDAAIRAASLERQISITGWIPGDRVKAEILASRALILPSFSENMPVVIMEAMALGRPVISTYIAGIPELVTPGITGWLVPSSDEKALAEAMREVLEAPIDRLAAMGTAGRKHVREQHDISKEVKNLKILLAKSLQK